MNRNGQKAAEKKKSVCTKKRLCCFLCAFFLLLAGKTAKAVEQPSLSAASSVLYEPYTGQFFFEKDADRRRPMASTTKIMTALVAIENIAQTDVITVAPEAVGIEGSSVYLQAGERVTVEDLLYALLLQSANDAAAALAIGIAGSVESFADMMNERAAALGLQSTHFKNPHGLHDDDHYTTARELAIIAGEAMKNPVFRKIASTVKHTITLQNGEVSRTLVNHNRMLRTDPHVIGVKTGFTKAGGRCLVGASERDDLMLITVTLNAPSDWQDHKKLFDYGFENYECVTLAERGEYTVEAPVFGSKKGSVTLHNARYLRAVVPRGKSCMIRAELYARPLIPPLSHGMHVGDVCAVLDGKCVGRAPLVVADSFGTKQPRK